MSNEVTKTKRETIAACLTCPLCNNFYEQAASISECLHTFCRKCIYDKITYEDLERCPVCNIDLGCVPLEKLRLDHSKLNLRYIVFPSKRREVKESEVAGASVPLPAKRKERSLSSLVVNTPRVSAQSTMTERRTKPTRKSFKSNTQRSDVKPEHVQVNESDSLVQKIKNKENKRKAKAEDEKSSPFPVCSDIEKPNKLRRVCRKKEPFRESGISLQAVVDSTSNKHFKSGPIWFSLATENQEEATASALLKEIDSTSEARTSTSPSHSSSASDNTTKLENNTVRITQELGQTSAFLQQRSESTVPIHCESLKQTIQSSQTPQTQNTDLMDIDENNALAISSEVPSQHPPLTMDDLFMSSDILDQALILWCYNSITVDEPANLVHRSELQTQQVSEVSKPSNSETTISPTQTSTEAKNIQEIENLNASIISSPAKRTESNPELHEEISSEPNTKTYMEVDSEQIPPSTLVSNANSNIDTTISVMDSAVLPPPPPTSDPELEKFRNIIFKKAKKLHRLRYSFMKPNEYLAAWESLINEIDNALENLKSRALSELSSASRKSQGLG